MPKKLINLTPAQAGSLKALASKQGITQTELIRNALSAYCDDFPRDENKTGSRLDYQQRKETE